MKDDGQYTFDDYLGYAGVLGTMEDNTLDDTPGEYSQGHFRLLHDVWVPKESLMKLAEELEKKLYTVKSQGEIVKEEWLAETLESVRRILRQALLK